MKMKRVKHSVAVLIFDGDLILAVRRSDHDDELPGIWGLPAGTCRDDETIQDVIRRIGAEKLGVVLRAVRRMDSGIQSRSSYDLKMELWEATMEGQPRTGGARNYQEWQWASVDLLKEGAGAGSLCCELALRTNDSP
jgi:8-oxo-dGTP pyrophosphatase MutT (NUDIX family)